MRGAVGGTLVGAGGVIVAASGGVAQGVVGVVYLLEFLGSGYTGGVIVRDTVGVGLEGCSRRGLVWLWRRGGRGVPFIGFTDLLLGCV